MGDLAFMAKPGVVQTPPRIVKIQALTVTTAVLVFLAMWGSCAAPEVGRKGARTALVTGIICLAGEDGAIWLCEGLISRAVAFCTSTAALGLASTYDYYVRFRGGSGNVLTWPII